MDEMSAEILELVKKKMVEQAAFDRASYEELVDETIEYFCEKGKLTDEDNVEFIKDELMAMFESVEDELAE
jgi:polyhydroxyalkanoate synthesis regulator phasin